MRIQTTALLTSLYIVCLLVVSEVRLVKPNGDNASLAYETNGLCILYVTTVCVRHYADINMLQIDKNKKITLITLQQCHSAKNSTALLPFSLRRVVSQQVNDSPEIAVAVRKNIKF